MIDKIITWLSNKIVSKILPSTLVKMSITALIVSLPLSLVLGYGVIIVTLVCSHLLLLANEYLYTKGEEENITNEQEN